MHRFTAEKALLFLVVFTLGLVIFQEFLLEKRLVIEPGTGYLTRLDSDVQDGGDTRTEWVDQSRLHWRCELGQAYDYPFCGMQIYFSNTYLQGVDLTHYTHLNLHLSYRGDAQSLRLFLRNSNPVYTRPDEVRSTKFNMIELDVRKGPHYRDLLLNYFRVADWWLLIYHPDVQYSQIEFTNIGLIEIQTGSGLKEGTHEFQLHRLELVGVYISVEHLYLGIIITWICAILLYLATRIRSLSRAVEHGKLKQAELTEINTLLDQRSRTLEEKSKLDPLTGAYNRAGIEESLIEAFRHWKYDDRPLSLLLLDVDHFKQINDTLGHATGDLVLRELTFLISQHIRTDDRFARWGGEEFIIVCGNTELDKASDMAEKIRRLVEHYTFADSLKVTVSIGVAQIQEGENLEALFSRSDQALYEAKRAGRNRVRVSQVSL